MILDTDEWETKLSEVHQNKFIRKYKRRHYVLNNLKYRDYKLNVKEGFSLENVVPNYISKCNLKNSEKVMDWVNNWGTIDNFSKYDVGFMIRNEDTVVYNSTLCAINYYYLFWMASFCFLDLAGETISILTKGCLFCHTHH
ncbi:GNAT family N-acetyltransferase [Clostridium sp. UBA6640]|uniref:GNAT family N-acetyltransferase n=1 Tax=Clostridium sp. UBA6640 TaxID=1946370 RepID=UPI0025BDF18B|nr:GNAT family N-acetyltransferase [Clostridium sp. UBA6640]